MRDVQIYLTRVHAEIPADADRGTFPLTLPFVEGLDIQFKTPVTFIVGENGAGKSTLLEALSIWPTCLCAAAAGTSLPITEGKANSRRF